MFSTEHDRHVFARFTRFAGASPRLSPPLTPRSGRKTGTATRWLSRLSEVPRVWSIQSASAQPRLPFVISAAILIVQALLSGTSESGRVPQNMNILVVDDERVTRELVRRELVQLGHVVHAAADVAEAEAVLAHNKVELVVTDVRMPGQSGIDLLHLVKEHHAGTEVIIMTGHPEISTAVSAVADNAFAYLRKPFRIEELAKIVERAGEHIAMQEQVARHARELAASERRYRTLVEGINGVVVLTDRDLMILSVSERCNEILGRPASELVGMSVDDLRPSDDAEKFRGQVQTLLDQRTEFVRLEGRVARPDGSLLDTVEVAMQSVADPSSGEPAGICWVIADASVASRFKREAEIARDYLDAVRRSASGSRRIVGDSKAIRQVLDTIKSAAPTNASVLITGESGTGKELVAESIHLNSGRAERPFVVISCATLQETLLESELFGYKQGAFTGAVRDKRGLAEIADGGTLFVDEVGEMAPSVQSKLLRVLETGQFRQLGSTEDRTTDIRVVAATNRDLVEDVKSGRFREDLFYRLDVVRVQLPPLRDRKEDVPLIAEHLLRHTEVTARQSRHLASDALNALMAYDWPGNIRELSNVLERAVILAGDSEEIRAAHLSLRPSDSRPAVQTFRQLENDEIAKALAITGGNKTEAARMLGITRQTLTTRLKLRP